MWKSGILETDGGLLNRLIGIFGIAPKNWTMTTGALLAIIIAYTLWADIGYNVVLFSAGLEGVPREFDEAAAIDGAGRPEIFKDPASTDGEDLCICCGNDDGKLFSDVCTVPCDRTKGRRRLFCDGTDKLYLPSEFYKL